MVYRTLTAGLIAAAGLVANNAAADPGTATGNVNMRTGPGTGYPVITTIPAGAPIEVLGCPSWCQVAYAGTQGYVSGRYVSGAGYVQQAPQAYYAPGPTYAPMPAPRAYYRSAYPWWDDGYYDDDWGWRHRYGYGPGIGFSFGFGN